MRSLQLRTTHLFSAAAFVVASGLVAPPVGAQIGDTRLSSRRYQQTPESRVLLITTLRGPDRRVAVQGTDVLAEQIRARIQAKELFLISKASVEELLHGSSFPLDTALSAHDARLVGRQLRADEYLDAHVESAPNGRGFQMRGRLYLMVDPFLNDVLPTADPGTQMRHAADALVRSLQDVRKQLPHERECSSKNQEGKYAEAEVAARAGIEAYQDGTIVRICLIRALAAQRKGADALLAVAQEVLQRDSLNRHALAYAVDAYLEKADTANYVSHAVRLISVDITNSTMVQNIVNVLAQMHRADVAIPSVERAIIASPLDSKLVDLSVLLYIGAERWADAARRSEEFLRLDPDAADSAFFVKMAVAYRNDSQPEKATDALRRAAEKFPQSAGLKLLYGQELSRAGNTEGAIGAYKQALETDPKLPSVRTFIAAGYQQLNQPDSTLAWLRLAHAAGEDSTTIAGMARVIGGRRLQAAQASNALQDFQQAIPALALADSVSPSNEAKWWWTLAEFNIAKHYVEQLQVTPTCELAQKAKASTDMLPILIRGGGGQVDGGTAGQIMTAWQQFLQYSEAMITEHCKTSS